MGAAGNMIMAALLELVDNKVEFLKQINSLGLGRVKIEAESVLKCGIKGTHICVSIDGLEETSYHHHAHFSRQSHNHTDLRKIKDIVAHLQVSEKVKNDALNIYEIISEAEAGVHGQTIEQIHFHEVGDLDAITDIVGVCLLMESIAPKEIIVSPVNVGSGFVHCAHGILPVPVPATVKILQNIPIYSTDIRDELCTPTGAAIIKYFAVRFAQMPNMRVQKIGYGMGTKNFETANCLRAFLGETGVSENEKNDCIVQLQCNLDDMTGEAIGFVFDLLLQKGALDVFTIPIQMKKNRPAILFTCLCSEDKADFFVELLFRHTTTFGVRKTICSRHVLKHTTLMQQTEYGNIRIKRGQWREIKKSKPEYDDISKAALLNDMSLAEVSDVLVRKKEKK
jgi:uncharacterized protein (TIGR00299 family) protein